MDIIKREQKYMKGVKFMDKEKLLTVNSCIKVRL
jgi:hypothetical protein